MPKRRKPEGGRPTDPEMKVDSEAPTPTGKEPTKVGAEGRTRAGDRGPIEVHPEFTAAETRPASMADSEPVFEAKRPPRRKDKVKTAGDLAERGLLDEEDESDVATDTGISTAEVEAALMEDSLAELDSRSADDALQEPPENPIALKRAVSSRTESTVVRESEFKPRSKGRPESPARPYDSGVEVTPVEDKAEPSVTRSVSKAGSAERTGVVRNGRGRASRSARGAESIAGIGTPVEQKSDKANEKAEPVEEESKPWWKFW